MTIAMRINMTGLPLDRTNEAERYQAIVELAVLAEQAGMDFINLEEHHCADNGWLASPLLLASMIAAVTKKIKIGVTALLIPLYDPIRLAEEIAVLDVVSKGRFSFVAGMGYRPIEYHAMNKDWSKRGQLMEDCISILLQAWTGEPFEYRGKMVRVSPQPISQPHPFFFVGGMSEHAARRAARFGLPFYPATPRPDLEAVYYQALKEYGQKGFVYSPDSANTMTFVDTDPEQAWLELGPYFLSEMQEYSRWGAKGVQRPSEQAVMTIDEVKQSGRFEIITPAECRQRRETEPQSTLVLHPLAGGIPIERAMESLTFFQAQAVKE